MSRALSLAARQAVNAQETGEVFLLLLTLDHDELAAPIRVVNNTVDIVSRGNTYIAYPFQLELPAEDADQISSVRLSIDNVDRTIVQSLRAISSPVAVTIEVVLASSPDTVEAGPFAMSLVQAEYDALVIQGELAFEDVLTEPFPGHAYVPADYPGLF